MQDYTKTDELPPVLKKLGDTAVELIESMAVDNCINPVLVLANDEGNTTIYLLSGFDDRRHMQMVQERVDEFKKDNRLVAICLAAEAWMCDENSFREYMNLDEHAAREHLLSTGVEPEAAEIIIINVIQNVLLNTAHMYQSLFGDLAMLPSSFEGIPFRMESIWGVYQRTCEIVRGIDEMALEFRNDWRQMVAPGGVGMYTNMLQLDPGK